MWVLVFWVYFIANIIHDHVRSKVRRRIHETLITISKYLSTKKDIPLNTIVEAEALLRKHGYLIAILAIYGIMGIILGATILLVDNDVKLFIPFMLLGLSDIIFAIVEVRDFAGARAVVASLRRA